MGRIKTVKAENFGPLRFMQFSPTGTLIEICGMNGQGKSRALAGLRAVLLGEVDGRGDVITHGEDESTYSVALEGGLTATMRWTGKGREFELTEITGKGPKPVPLKKPRAIMEAYVGKFHDVTKITKIETPEGERGLRDLLLQSAGVDPKAADDQIAAAKLDRLNCNREVERLQAKLDGLDRPGKDTPTEPVSAAELMAQEQLIRDDLANVQANVVTKEALQRALEAEEAEGRRLAALLEESRKRWKEHKAKVDGYALMVPTYSEENLAEVRGQIESLDKTNAAIRAAHEWKVLHAELDAAKKDAGAAEMAVREATTAKMDMLEGVKLPIPGAVVTDEGVTFNGERFYNLSRAQRLVVGVALGLATRGSLDVLMVDDAEGLDKVNKGLIEKMAAEAGVQVVLARAVEDASGIFITGADDVEVEAA